MNVIEANVELIDSFDGHEILKKLELIGRVCYKSEDKITKDSAVAFIKKIIKNGHESVLEHVSITFKFICDRGVSHELVRHRIASYSQESTRYCDYTGGTFRELTFIKPVFWNTQQYRYEYWWKVMREVEIAYIHLRNNGASPQEARSVLPNSLKTEVVCTMNLRSLRNFFKLRCAKSAHPQMQEVAMILLERLNREIPVVFEDLAAQFIEDSKESEARNL